MLLAKASTTSPACTYSATLLGAGMIVSSDSSRDMFAVRDAVNHYYNGTANQRVIYTESHDEVANGKSRVPEEIWPGNASSWFSKKRSTLGAAVVFTAPGIPMIFQGQEFLEDGFFADTDPLDWTKLTTFAGIKDMYRDMIRLRRNWYDTTRGLRGNNLNVHHVNDGAKLIAFHRWMHGGPGDDVIVVANFANTTWQSYTLGFQYTANTDSGGTWVTRLDYNYQGQFWRSEPFLRVDAYEAVPNGYEESGDWGILNLRVAYEPADANYQVAFFGTNLTDEYTINSGFFHGIWGYDFATLGRPREAGASLTFRF